MDSPLSLICTWILYNHIVLYADSGSTVKSPISADKLLGGGQMRLCA